MFTHEIWMSTAIEQAKKAKEENEVPIGAIIVKNNKIIGAGYNQVESTNDATQHAEIVAIKKASKNLKNWRLKDCIMYVTLEPCEMCLTAIKLARINEVIFGSDRNYVAVPDIKLTGGCLKKETDLLLTSFFKTIRKDK